MYKKRRQLLIALVLLGLIATGATIAFLSTATSSLTNTFTKGYNDVGQRKYHNNKMRYFLCPT